MSSIPSSSNSRPRARKKPTRPEKQPVLQTKWRTGAQERIYGHRLIDALRAARDRAQPPESVGSRAVKEAADSALALTARGRTRWSRAILLGRNGCRRRRLLVKAGGKVRGHRRKQQIPAQPPPAAEPGVLKERKVKDRLKKLARLVPGCRKLAAPALLEEAADYVAALEMQVRAMRALADALSAASVSDPEPAQPATAEPGS